MKTKEYIGEARLLSVGFERVGNQTFALHSIAWDRVKRKNVRVKVAEVILDKRGNMISEQGLRRDSSGRIVLFQRG